MLCHLCDKKIVQILISCKKNNYNSFASGICCIKLARIIFANILWFANEFEVLFHFMQFSFENKVSRVWLMVQHSFSQNVSFTLSQFSNSRLLITCVCEKIFKFFQT